jgi:NitT/TauT family transport system permease protein
MSIFSRIDRPSRLPGGSPRPRWVRVAVPGVIGTLAILAMVELVVRLGWVNNTYFPPPSLMLLRVGQQLMDPAFLGDVAATSYATVLGLLVAIVVAVPLGIILGSSRLAYAAAKGIVELLRPIPSVALVPLAILVFGGGVNMKVSLIVYASIWPILFNAIYGAHDVEPLAKDTARSFGLKPWAILWRVTLPHAAPFIATGVRVAAAISLVLAISAELLAGGAQGLGTWMLQVEAVSGRTDLIFAGVTVAGILGLLLNGILTLIERRLFPWHRQMQGLDK